MGFLSLARFLLLGKSLVDFDSTHGYKTGELSPFPVTKSTTVLRAIIERTLPRYVQPFTEYRACVRSLLGQGLEQIDHIHCTKVEALYLF